MVPSTTLFILESQMSTLFYCELQTVATTKYQPLWILHMRASLHVTTWATCVQQPPVSLSILPFFFLLIQNLIQSETPLESADAPAGDSVDPGRSSKIRSFFHFHRVSMEKERGGGDTLREGN